MTEISLKEFIKTGKFGPIELGMHRKHILNLIGPPDGYDHGQMHEWMRCKIWMYGDMEFHFGPANRLFLIWCDHFPMPGQSSDSIDLDLWILGNSNLLFKEYLVRTLDQAEIPYNTQQNEYGFEALGFASGVEITVGDPQGYLLDNSSCKDEDKVVLSIGLKNIDFYTNDPPLKQISFQIPIDVFEQIQQVAQKRHISKATLCAQWMIERVIEETEVGSTDYLESRRGNYDKEI